MVVGARRGTKQAARPTTPTKSSALIGRPSRRSAHGGNRHNPERQFFGPDYHPGNYVFTLVTDALRIRTHDPTAVRPSRRGGCGPVPFLRWHYATHTQPAGGALKAGVSPKSSASASGQTPTLPGSSSAQYSGRANRNPAAVRSHAGWSHNWQSSRPRGPISAKTDGLNHPGFLVLV